MCVFLRDSLRAGQTVIISFPRLGFLWFFIPRERHVELTVKFVTAEPEMHNDSAEAPPDAYIQFDSFLPRDAL